jgi:hypothetical protein
MDRRLKNHSHRKVGQMETLNLIDGSVVPIAAAPIAAYFDCPFPALFMEIVGIVDAEGWLATRPPEFLAHSLARSHSPSRKGSWQYGQV